MIVHEFIEKSYIQSHHTDFSNDLSDSRMRNVDLRIIRAVGSQGLCTIGWDTSLISHKEPYWVKTFNMYTHQFGTMRHPHSFQDLPDIIKESAHPFQQHSKMTVEFSIDHPDVVEHCAGTMRDDDFEILFGDYGYVVWAFDDVKLPITGSLSDESMQITPAERPLPLNRRPTRLSTNR